MSSSDNEEDHDDDDDDDDDDIDMHDFLSLTRTRVRGLCCASVSHAATRVAYEYSHLVSSCAIQSESFFIVPRSRAAQVRPARDSSDPTTATANEAWYAIHIYQGANATGP